ncbi:pyruvate:ferredoxin (flavodoxin) oxidoreductase [Synechococcus sp. JJ3a-Johnson]|uniref:pyruvate:ferredoxin (flavodoxin) oxidoreductase n=1 Tax=Synechococcus sp. JJ3a-Johnson TaxID=2823738 RepID=UPI0020CC57BC|nr:pyruvate:ferredoxin (flavodoxin) oxidoreductase [Synechococcus sp. JJ3a-Johnson]MCP9832089.1 pyruvate:ferredoxin (flavodoxin) oxidoreductase [Synechococcus sp. JJ3a-Johnson]
MSPPRAWIDGNEAVARVAYRLNEVMAIYPITPASPMGEWADAWAAEGHPNLWGSVPAVVEMQSEAGAAGVVHGALQAGALTTPFTASQGLLLMIPNLYKIAGELTAAVIHVASRALATSGLSIFGDHSDVMATRGTGCGLLFAASVQEAGDFAAIATAATLASRVPLLHVFDGFRTSHEIQAVELLDDTTLQDLIPAALIAAHRARGLSPDHPQIRGTSQNPDVCFQAREATNRFHDATPLLVQEAMDRFGALTGRHYALFDYQGHPAAERVLVLMGSGCGAASEAMEALLARGERVGLLHVRLFRPLASQQLVGALPASTQAIAVLDRCKEPGSGGEPLYLDVVAAVAEHWPGPKPGVVGGRYGLASKEFTPAMVKAVLDNLAASPPKNHFTVGITDDVTHHSLEVDPSFDTEHPDTFRAVFYGLGSDGTVGANKNAIKIIGEATGLHTQGYFVYDSKKAGSVTVSHLRFGPQPIRSTYLIRRAQLVACHHWDFLEQFDVMDLAAPGATLLLNSPWPPEQCWPHIPAQVQAQIRAKGLRVFALNASAIAQEHGLGHTINTVMQVGFFAVAAVMPMSAALSAIRSAIQHSYGHKGEAIVARNLGAVEAALGGLREITPTPGVADRGAMAPEPLPCPAHLATAPAVVRELVLPQLQRRADALPVSALPCDGSFASGTAQWEKRNIAEAIPVWEPDLCVQCGKCVMVCPHAVIRATVVEPAALASAPEGFRSAPARDRHWQGQSFTIQVAGEDCTGCRLCVEVCPARDRQAPQRKALNMEPQRPLRTQSRNHWEFFLALPQPDRRELNLHHIGQQQLQQPLFEFSGACAGCGETPYLKLASQLFGDRMVIANATGCSSIYGGNLPTTPWSTNAEGRGPAWSNSLFEDNAEFGLGFHVAFNQRRSRAEQLLRGLADHLPQTLVDGLLEADQGDEAGIHEQRERVGQLKQQLSRWRDAEGSTALANANANAAELEQLADDLVKRSVWIVGGDGWAYDIGFGGIDHLFASNHDVNLLVLDTEVYSNTGGQMSKATPKGAVAPFASSGKSTTKKDLGLIAMTYGQVYVASVAMGARDEHTLRAFLEAESFPGPSLILAYCHCIAHGIDMAKGMAQQKLAVDSGRWLLYRHDPRRRQQGLAPLVVDSHSPSVPLAEAMASENRFRRLHSSHPERARALSREAEEEQQLRWNLYQRLAGEVPRP